MSSKRPAPTRDSASGENPRMDADALGTELEALLAKLLQAHERLLQAIEQHRIALSHASGDEIRAAVEQETTALVEIADLERARATLVGANEPRTLSQLAETLPEPARDRILGMAAQLRELIQVLRTRQAIVRSATRSLLSHTHGLMAQVGAALSHAGTYGRAGRVQSTTPACAALDLST